MTSYTQPRVSQKSGGGPRVSQNRGAQGVSEKGGLGCLRKAEGGLGCLRKGGPRGEGFKTGYQKF